MSLIHCKHCGNAVSDRATTCPHCGHNLNENATEQQSHPASPVPPTSAEASNECMPAPSSGTNKALIAAIVVLVLIALGLGGYLLFGHKGNADAAAPTADSLATDTTAVDTLQTDTVKVEEAPKDVYANLNGIGTIRKGDLAANAVPMLIDPTAQGDFYDRVQVEKTDRNPCDVTYEVVLYRGKEKLCSFTTDAPYLDGMPSKKQIAKGHIEQFSIYSPTIKLQDGIHVGLSAKELVEKHHAKILYYSNVETDGLCFKFSSYPDNFEFKANGRILKTDFVEVEPDIVEEYLSLKEVKGCKLTQINF